MRLSPDRILDRIWLALAGPLALAVALDLGARLGHGSWVQGAGAVLAAEAAVRTEGGRPERPGHACGPHGAGPAR